VLAIVVGGFILLGGALALYRIFFGLCFLMVRRRPLATASAKRRFLILVPARNEAACLPETLASIQSLRWPRESLEVVVLADHCSDATVEVAEATERVGCIIREEGGATGKGAAIEWYLAQHLPDGFDAVCIVDADCEVDPRFLQVINDHLEEGVRAVQVHNGLSNPHESWLTSLTDLSWEMQNRLFYEGRSRLGLTAAIMGTGFCLRTDLIREIGWGALSLAEDWEFTARLLLEGEKVRYAPQTSVLSRLPPSLRAASGQRKRWSHGWFEVRRRYAAPLLRRLLARPGLVSADRVLFLLVPPNSALFNWCGVGLLSAWALPVGDRVLTSATAFGVALGVHLALGLATVRAPGRAVISLLLVPFYCIWKGLVDLGSMAGVRRVGWPDSHRDGRNRR